MWGSLRLAPIIYTQGADRHNVAAAKVSIEDDIVMTTSKDTEKKQTGKQAFVHSLLHCFQPHSYNNYL